MKKKLKFQVTNPDLCLWPFCLLMKMLTGEAARFYGYQSPACIIELKGRNNRVALEEEKYNSFPPIITERAVNDPLWTKKIISGIKKYSSELIAYTNQRIFKVDLAGLSGRKILGLYNGYEKKFLKMYTYGWFPNILEGTKWYLTGLLKKNLENKIKEFGFEEGADHCLSILLTPWAESARVAEEKSLWRITDLAISKEKIRKIFALEAMDDIRAALASSYPELYRRIRAHYKKYNYIPFCYDGPAWDLDYFLGRVKELLKNNFNYQQRLKEKEAEKAGLKETQKKLLEKLAIRQDKKFYQLLLLARAIMFLKDYRKDILYKSYYQVDKLIREIASRLDLTAVQVKHLLPEEMAAALMDGKYNPDILNERIKYSVLTVKNGTSKIYITAAARKIIKDNIAEEKKLGTVKELKGESAYHGLAKGQVKIVVNAADIGKVNQGDILVSLATNPNLLPAMEKAGAIITDKGGITCHAAIVARELGKPCIIGTKIATKVLHDGDLVEVDADQGIVKIIK